MQIQQKKCPLFRTSLIYVHNKDFFGICPNESLVINNKGNPLLKKKKKKKLLEKRHFDPKKFLIKINKGIPLLIFCCISKSINFSY